MAPVDIPHPKRFTAGTLGEPGQRVFFLQAAGADGQLVTLRCEKQQVGVLAEHLARLVSDLAEPERAVLEATDVDFVEPTDVAWVLGRMGVAWDNAAAAMVLVCEELVLEPDDGDEDEDPDEVDEDAADGVEPSSVRLRLSLPQVVAFVDVARGLLSAGRPPCYLCGLPMEPTGHPCPRLN